MRIGELAAASGVSAKTIRYYEDIAVLDPPARTPSGYRDYTPEATERLAFIRSAQAVGLTLGEIRGDRCPTRPRHNTLRPCARPDHRPGSRP
jgi:MerR family transcriptional regulator, copper efflux regulator